MRSAAAGDAVASNASTTITSRPISRRTGAQNGFMAPANLCESPHRIHGNGVYGMRMARVNITIPDAVLERARSAGLNVSRVATLAVSEELDRLARIAALDGYLRDLERDLGPVGADEETAAREWADRAFGDVAPPASPAPHAS